MMGIGWQELVVIAVSLVMCVGFFVAFSLPFIILVRRFRGSRPPMHEETPPRILPPQPEPEGSQWGKTKYGFDESDWGSDFDDRPRDDEPRIETR